MFVYDADVDEALRAVAKLVDPEAIPVAGAWVVAYETDGEGTFYVTGSLDGQPSFSTAGLARFLYLASDEVLMEALDEFDEGQDDDE